MRPVNILILFALAGFPSCKKSNSPASKPGGFSDVPQQIAITGGTLPEASGIADSKINPGFLWVEEDSGNPADIYLMGHDGKISRTIPITNAQNRDWEDIVLGEGPEPGKKYLYLGDIGDNNLTGTGYVFYRFEEPLMSVAEINNYNKLTFQYPDGSHDAEAFLVEAGTKDIYVITKRDAKSKVYKLSYPQDTMVVINATFVSDLAFNGVVSAALSPDNKELIVKTYTALYYYSREASESVATTLARTPVAIGYLLEEQGEAVTFAIDNTGFYTLSEIRNNNPSTLDFYRRN